MTPYSLVVILPIFPKNLLSTFLNPADGGNTFENIQICIKLHGVISQKTVILSNSIDQNIHI
jgi:hypothetical protein